MLQEDNRTKSENQTNDKQQFAEENLIYLSAEAQLKLAELILNPTPPSPQIERLKATRDKLFGKSSD